MVFSEFSTPGRLTTLQGKDTYLRIFGKHKLFLIDVFKKRHKFGWVGIVGVGVAEYYLNTWYEIIKELRKKKRPNKCRPQDLLQVQAIPTHPHVQLKQQASALSCLASNG